MWINITPIKWEWGCSEGTTASFTSGTSIVRCTSHDELNGMVWKFLSKYVIIRKKPGHTTHWHQWSLWCDTPFRHSDDSSLKCWIWPLISIHIINFLLNRFKMEIHVLVETLSPQWVSLSSKVHPFTECMLRQRHLQSLYIVFGTLFFLHNLIVHFGEHGEQVNRIMILLKNVTQCLNVPRTTALTSVAYKSRYCKQ